MRTSHRMPWHPISSDVSGLGRRSFRIQQATPHNHGLRIISQAPQYSQHEAPMRARGVGPCVAERAEPGLAVGDRGKGVQEIPCRSGQAIEPGHHQHVAGVDLVERLAQLVAVGLGPARCLAEHLLASGLGQLTDLCLDALTVRRYPRVPVFHGFDMHLINAPEKLLSFNGSILVQNS